MEAISRSATLVDFLNSGLGLLLIGSLVGALGLFTWQRQDWLFKQRHLRAQVMLDSRLNTIEKVSADVGRLLATATAPVVTMYKAGPSAQLNEAIKEYNDQQVEWFTAYHSHESLIAFYFSPELSEAFSSKIVRAYEDVDIQLSRYLRNRGNDHYRRAYEALQKLRDGLRSWNSLALNNLQQD